MTERREALVVGINRYPLLRNEKTREPQHLEKPAADAEAIAQMLENYGNFKVRRLPEVYDSGEKWRVDPEPAPQNLVTVPVLERAIAQLFHPPGFSIPDTALLFFAGHGLRKEQGGVTEGFLATSDVNPNKGKWGVSLRWLRELLQKSPVRQQIIWLDCCYSGELLNFIEEADPGEAGIAPRDRCLIAASREFEEASEELRGNHGVLTGALLQALNPERSSSDGLVTNYSLEDFIKQELQKSRQCPIFHNSGSQIILTGKKEKFAPAVLKASKCPFKGLDFFDFNDEDPEYFYGREELTKQLLKKVEKQNFLAVVGPSGSGKSSVVRAGLLYKLKQVQSDQWVFKIFRPDKHPLESLALAFAEDEKLNALNLLKQGAEGLKNLVKATARERRLALVVDQFEEAFTLCENETERQQFLDCVLKALEITDNKLCLILTMRADFIGKCADYKALASKIENNMIILGPMKQEELAQAIIEPANKVGLEVEQELVTQMLADVEGPGSLPLLQYTLTELWEQRQAQRLVLAEYIRLGGVKGTLQKRADEVYESLPEKEQQTAKRIFLELTQLGEGAEDTRRQVLKKDLMNEQSAALVEEVLHKLANARLIVTSELRARGEGDKTVIVVVDVAHEALIRHWSRLGQWLQENREAIPIRRMIEQAAKEWERKKESKQKQVGLLLQGEQLVKAETYLQDDSDLGLLSSLAQKFIELSKARRDWIAKKEKKQIKILTELVIKARLGEQAALARLKNPAEGLITAIKLTGDSRNKFNKVLDSVRGTLFDLLKEPVERNILTAHKQNITSVAFNPNGRYIASGSEDKTVRVWDLEGNPVNKPLREHEDYVNSIAFSPDGRYIVTASSDKKVRLWDLNGNNPLAILEGHENVVSSVAFSPDGKYIVSGGYDGMRLWDREGNLNQPLVIHKDRVFSVAFSPDGRTIASANWKAVHLWDLKKGNFIGKPIKVHEYAVYSVAFSPDGQHMATSGTDGLVKLVSLKGKKVILTIELEGDSHVNSVAFSSQGEYIAIASGIAVQITDIKGKFIGKPLKHDKKVTSVAFSADGQYIVTGSWDRTVRLWELRNIFDPLPSPEDDNQLLQVACNRLFYHSALVEAKTKEAKAACKTCQKDVWDKIQTAQFLLNQGRVLARGENIEEAVAKFKQAQDFDPTLDITPEKEAEFWAAFAQSETRENATGNQMPLPELPNHAIYGQVTLSDFTLNNQGNVVRVAPGEKISAFTQYIYDCPGCSPGSINQIIVGIAGQNEAQACIYNGSIQGSGSSQFTLTAPDEPGIYYIRFRYAQAYGCDTALGWWRVDGEPTSEANIGVVVVLG